MSPETTSSLVGVAPASGTSSLGRRPRGVARVAVFLIGGIGEGIALQGVPAIAAIIGSLAEAYRITVYSLIPPHPRFTPKNYAVRTTPRWFSTTAAKKLRWPWLSSRFVADHARQPYDVILSFGGYPMGLVAVGLAELFRTPSMIVLLGAEAASVPSIGYGQLRKPVSRRLVLETCARASTLVVLSNDQREALRSRGLRRGDVEVVPFGADRMLFQSHPKRFEPPLKLIHVANLTEVKDQSTLLRGFALLRRDMDARLRIVGPDFMNGRLQRLAQTLGLRDDVEFVGPVPHEALARHHRWADMFVLTSLSEGQNIAITEAAMSGLLAVSTPVGWIKDMGEKGAVLLRFGDPADLAAKVRGIATDRTSWEKKIAHARSCAEAHDSRWTLERLAAVIDRTRS